MRLEIDFGYTGEKAAKNDLTSMKLTKAAEFPAFIYFIGLVFLHLYCGEFFLCVWHQ